ncbi:MAG: hypothetical protein ACXWRE_04415 [Pseudobdellovibrionaceae bacterium]
MNLTVKRDILAEGFLKYAGTMWKYHKGRRTSQGDANLNADFKR